MKSPMLTERKRYVRLMLLELLLYSVFVSLYLVIVLHSLQSYLAHLSIDHPRRYAIVALALICGQGMGLELLTTFLVNFGRRRRK